LSYFTRWSLARRESMRRSGLRKDGLGSIYLKV
jgi:hypothetical protein